MIDKTYRCDLCNASVPAEILDKFLFGIYWIDNPHHGWTLKNARECEHHICNTCLTSLQIVFKQTVEKKP
jgi:hypothetical protein